MPPRIGPKNIRLARVYLQAWREHVYPTMSQEQFGLKFEPPVDKGTISRWENAKPGRLTLGVIAAYAEALNKKPAQMYRRPPKEDNEPSLDETADEMGLDRTMMIGVMRAFQGRKAG